MIEWWGPVVHEYYAGTEGNGFVYCNSEEWLAHPGTVGRALLGTLHIVDDDGNELPPGEPGTVYFEGERRPSSTTTTPRRRPASPPPEGLVDARRRRLPRRGRLPLPHRPQGVHDHLAAG